MHCTVLVLLHCYKAQKKYYFLFTLILLPSGSKQTCCLTGLSGGDQGDKYSSKFVAFESL